MIKPIFSTGISVHNLENVNNSEIVEYVKTNNNFNKPKDIKKILSEPIFKNLNNVIEQKINDHYHEIYNNKYNVALIEAWGNTGNDSIITMPHIHTTSFLSAVYYPHATEGCLTFLNPMVGLLLKQNIDMIDQHSPYTSECYNYPSKTGSLIIFNSLLMHFVRCEGNNDRVSLAYNAVIEGLKNPGVEFRSNGKGFNE